MQRLDKLFGESPFDLLVKHALAIRDCVNLIRPIADAIIAGDMERLIQLQDQMARTEFEGDRLKDEIRERLPHCFFLPVAREDMFNFVRQLDRMGDDCEDFSVVATFWKLSLSKELQDDFLKLVDKVVDAGTTLLNVADDVSRLQKEAFTGADAEQVIKVVQDVGRKEWETDRISHEFARKYYSAVGLDTVTIILLEKLCRLLTGIADHAENVGKNLRLMITRH